jgi:hypothetical protein
MPKEHEMNRRKKGLLIALVLGDGYIQQQANTAGIKIEHSKDQMPYLIFKAELIHSLLGGKKPNILERVRFDKRTGRTYNSCLVYKSSRYFKLLRKWFYKPKKKLSRKLLDYLSEEGLAIWFMDDGWSQFRYSKKTGRVSSQQSYLGTYCPLEEAQEVQKYFKEKWDLEFKYYKTHNGSYVMCANTKDSLRFVELVKPYIIPYFNYKICSKSLATKARPRKGEDIV